MDHQVQTQNMQAADLQIAGLTPLSTVDWPGKIAATVFTQGCPWACSYCHNYTILDPRTPGAIPWEDVEKLMARRHGLLDGLVFSGGEATRQCALIPAMRAVREWGFGVGLHTAGPYPQALAHILDEGLVDWVGLDIKALRADYPAIIQRPNGGQRAWHSLDILIATPPPDYEIRLTVDHAGLATAYRVARECALRGVRNFALQHVRTQGASEHYTHTYTTPPPTFRHEVEEQIASIGFDRFTIR